MQKFLTFYGNRKFITAFTKASQLSISWARWFQLTSSRTVLLLSILKLPSHLNLCLPNGIFPPGFPIKFLSALWSLILFDFIILTLFEEYLSQIFSLWSFLQISCQFLSDPCSQVFVDWDYVVVVIINSFRSNMASAKLRPSHTCSGSLVHNDSVLSDIDVANQGLPMPFCLSGYRE